MVNLREFEGLLAAQASPKLPRGVPVKEAYQAFKRLESQRSRRGLDVAPDTVLGNLKEQLTLAPLRRSSSSGSLRSIPPPPKGPNRQDSAASLPSGANKPPPAGRPPPPGKPGLQTLIRRHSGLDRPPPPRHAPPKRHTLDAPPTRKKPPPPVQPPPSDLALESHRSAVSSVVSGTSGAASSSAAAGGPREAFLLRERLSQLENQLARERDDKALVKQHLLQAQRDLHLSNSQLKETEATLEGLRSKLGGGEQMQSELKEKLKQAQLEAKSAARKSRQRFDAAMDFCKGMLVDAKFENLLQVIKSRLRIIVGAERTEVYIVDHKHQELISYRERSGSRRPLPSGDKLWMGRFPMDTGIVGSVIDEKAMQVVREVETDVRFDALVDGIGSNGVRNLVVYPILMRQRVVAVIVVANKLSPNGRIAGQDFSSSDLAAIQDFASLSTLAFLQRQILTTRKRATRAKAKGGAVDESDQDESDLEEEEEEDDLDHDQDRDLRDLRDTASAEAGLM